MITIAQLAEVPFVDAKAIGGRTLLSLTFHDGEWHMWMAMGKEDQALVKIRGWPAEADYFAADPADEGDLSIPILDLVAQRASFTPLLKAFNGISDDVHNLAASLAKLALLERSADRVHEGLSRMAATEVEYVVITCRSLLDLLQELVAALWALVTPLDPTARLKKLKQSFADMTKWKGEPLDAARIAERHSVPLALAECYERGQELFASLKRVRDNVVHRGARPPHVYGGLPFVIARDLLPFPNLIEWREDEVQPNDLVPLLPAVQMIIHRTLAICDDFARVLPRIVALPPPVAPGMRLFTRAYFGADLRRALDGSVARLPPGHVGREQGGRT